MVISQRRSGSGRPEKAAVTRANEVNMQKKVTRFTPSERWFHNTVMFSFVLLLCTGLGMLYFNVVGDQGESRKFLVFIHEMIALLFIAGPIIAYILGDKKIWKENFRVMTKWSRNDLEWLIKKPLAVISSRITLPEDDKFNPGQKVWATIAVSGTLILTITGVIMWTTGSPILALVLHTLVALAMLGALLGHAFMALVNPDTRHGIGSIIDGEVDHEWASRHHPIWIRRHAKARIVGKGKKKAPVEPVRQVVNHKDIEPGFTAGSPDKIALENA